MEALSGRNSDRRRAPRIPAELLVMIEGLQEDFSLARGDISTGGVQLQLPSAPGSPGDLELLHLATRDGECRVAIMGQIIRCVTIDSLGEKSMVAVSFEFLPERAEVREALDELIEHIVEATRVDELSIESLLTGELEFEDEPLREATVFRLHVRRMALETSWPVNLGDRVQLAFRTGGARLPFEGNVTRVERIETPGPQMYAVDVALGELGERAKKPSTERKATTPESIDLILSDLIVGASPLPEPASRHLSGRLDRIALTSLLAFLEMERQSGQLEIEDGEGQVIYLDQGQVVDIEPQTEKPLAQLDQLLSRRQGRFAFTCQPVERENRIQQPTTHILLDWARREDEGELR